MRSSCIEGWPSATFFNFEYQLVKLSDAAFEFVKATDGNTTQTVGQLITQAGIDLAAVRDLQQQQVVLLTPESAIAG
jgi:hypothetical protein